MNHGNYTAIPSCELAGLLDAARRGIAAEAAELKLPRLAEIVLGGGYGRGEGGVRHTPAGDKLYNDLDFFVFSDRANKRERRAIEAALKPVSQRWEEKLGVAVDFSPVKNLSSLTKVGSTLMFQELRRGWKPVLGGGEFEKHFPELDAAQLPVSEAVRLLLNRGMGLVFAGETIRKNGDADFIMRNLHKSVLGGGDAMLLAAGKYRWRGADRVEAFREYAAAQSFPRDSPTVTPPPSATRSSPTRVCPKIRRACGGTAGRSTSKRRAGSPGVPKVPRPKR